MWEYLQLGADLSKGIFEQSDDAVALRSLKTHGVNGSLEFYSNSQWTAVRALTPSNALVLGKTSYLRYNKRLINLLNIYLLIFYQLSLDVHSLIWEDSGKKL